MYTKGKYLVGELPIWGGSNLGAVVIAETFGHDNIAPVFVPNTIVSGGFFHINDDLSVACYGESRSMGVKVNPEIDSKLLAKALALPSEHS